MKVEEREVRSPTDGAPGKGEVRVSVDPPVGELERWQDEREWRRAEVSRAPPQGPLVG